MSTSNILSQLGSPGVSTGFKNRIINGAMAIDQRNAGAVNTPANGGYSVDRWQSNYSGGGVYSCQQTTTAPAGFVNSLKLTVTTADASIAASDVYAISQTIEGYNIADLNEGTANAKTFTASFWVQSSVTGTYCVGFRSSSGDAGYAANYTISAANTWTYVTVTVPGTALGTWVTNNTAGLFILFDLGSGSNRNLTPNTWTLSAGFNTSSQTPWISTNGATFYITGVQLEVGTTATNFDVRSYGTELMLCQRYYWKWVPSYAASYIGTVMSLAVTTAYGSIIMPVTMRTNPTLSTSGTGSDYGGYVGGTSFISNAVPYMDTSNPNTPLLAFYSASAFTVGYATIVGSKTINGYLGFSAEL